MDRVVAVLGKNKVKEAIEVAKHLEQANAKQNIKKKRIDRDGRQRGMSYYIAKLERTQ